MRSAAKPSIDASFAIDCDQLLTVSDVAVLLRLTAKGVYALVESKRIPFIRVSNRVRFVRADLLQWLWENRVPASERSR